MRQEDVDFAKRVLLLVQAIVNGRPIQHMERDTDGSCLNWVDCDGISWISLEDYRAKPEKKWRPWKNQEAPKVFMAKEDDDVAGPPLVCRRDNENVIIYYPTGPKRISAVQLFESYNRVLEDDTRTKCGVFEEES